jgi:hypothetical protein
MLLCYFHLKRLVIAFSANIAEKKYKLAKKNVIKSADKVSFIMQMNLYLQKVLKYRSVEHEHDVCVPHFKKSLFCIFAPYKVTLLHWGSLFFEKKTSTNIFYLKIIVL